MRSRTATISLVGMFSLVMFTHAEENKTPKVDVAKIEALIDKLAIYKRSSNLSDDAQDDALKAWRELRDLGIQAFPIAIEHLKDKRTSFTMDSGSTDETWTVGRACRDVLWCNLEPYNDFMYSSSIPPKEYWWRPQYCRTFLNTPKKAKTWLAAHREKSLVDLQIELLEWVTSNRSKRKVEISVEDRKDLLDELATLKRTRKPLKPAFAWST